MAKVAMLATSKSAAANVMPLDGHSDRRLRVAMMSFEQVRPLISDYVTSGPVEIVSIVERDGRWAGASSARGAGQAVAISSLRLTLAAFDDERDRTTEDMIERVIAAEGLAARATHVIYKTQATQSERIVVAFVFGRPTDGPALDAPWLQAALSTKSLPGCFVYLGLQYCLSSREADTFFALAPDLLTRAAGQLLVQKVAKEWTKRDNAELYRMCCDIAESAYEGRSGAGSFIFLPRGGQNDAVATVKFRQPIHATHYVGARKLMEMSSGDFALLFDGDYFWGFASLSKLDSYPHIKFEGSGQWAMNVRHELLCLVSFGKPVPRSRVLTESAFKAHLRYCFPSITDVGVEKIWEIATVAAGQKVGTNILFTPEAPREARRLSSQCIPIEQVDLTPEKTLQLTAIDGTVIVDTEGAVHAIGAIMDGPSTPNGTWQRGGRYNSAANYVSSAKFPAMIFIVSQDGYVDVVPPVGQRGGKWTQSRYLRLSCTAT
jgi:hypothetical protein